MEFTRKHVANRRDPLPRLTKRVFEWLTFIDRHGPLPSNYLYEFTKGTHRCKDTALRQLQRLSQQGILFRPRQQDSALYSPFNPYVYDLTDRGNDALSEIGVEPNPARPTGHFPHLFLASCATASFEMACNRGTTRFIDARHILKLRNASLGVPVGRGKLFPDQLFATKSPAGFRVFALEIDRGTEPATSPKLRKSYQSAIAAYDEMIAKQRYRQHYGIKSNLIVLWVFTSAGRENAFRQVLASEGPRLFNQCFTTSIEGFHQSWRPPLTELRVTGTVWKGAKAEPLISILD